ncbi:hypothetical protein HDU67_004499, partial [Dinochytrium kinnereticum]
VARRVREAGGGRKGVEEVLIEEQEEEEEDEEEGPLPREAGKGSPGGVGVVSPVSPFRASSAFDAGMTASSVSSVQPSSVSGRVSSTPLVHVAASSIPRVYDPSNPDLVYPMSPLSRSLHRPKAGRQMDLNHPIVVRLTGISKLDMEHLRSALNVVTRRHPILRCIITPESDLRYDPSTSRVVEISSAVLGSPSDLSDEATMDAVRLWTSSKPFDDHSRRSANDELPLRVKLLTCSDASHLLCLVFNAALIDPASGHQVASELLTAYSAISSNRTEELAYEDEDPTFLDFSAWADACAVLPAPSYARQMEFWEWKMDRRATRIRLPTLDLGGRGDGGGGGRFEKLRREAGPGLSARVSVLQRSRSFAVSDTLMAGVVALMMRYSGAREVMVGTLARGRRPETEGVVGRFENLVPLRCRVEEGDAASFSRVVGVVRRAKLEAFENTDVPVDVVGEMVGAGAPIVQ